MQELTRLLTRGGTSSSLTEPQPCALMGSSWSSVTRKLATVTGVYDLPHTTSSASSVELDNAAEYPLFTRTHPSDASMALLSVDYLYTQLHVEFLAVLYIDNDFGNAYHENILQFVAEKYDSNLTIVSTPFREGASDDELQLALQRLADTGYRYILGVFFENDYERIMTIAYHLGIAGPGYFWMFNGALAQQFINGQTTLEKDSPAALATFGNAILTDEGGLPGLNPYHDRFLDEWKQIANNTQFMDYLHSKIPSTGSSESINFTRTGDFFANNAPSHIASFSYDAIASLALSACLSYKEYQETKQRFRNDENGDNMLIFSGAAHHFNMVYNTRFMGASGDVLIGPDSFSRQGESTYHVISNILPVEETTTTTTNASTTVSFQGIPLTVFDTTQRKWVQYNQEREFLYADGSTVPPQQLPPLHVDYNYIPIPVRAICLSLAGLAMVLSLIFAFYFCHLNKKDRVIRASQPLFLGMICVGTFLLASSIIPLAIDDSIASQQGCTIACILTSWMIPIGFCIVFSALFSKLWRINRIIATASTLRRIRVDVIDVMLPFAILLGLNCLVLALWTGLDTLSWTRRVVDVDVYGRVIESSGTCYSSHTAPFLVPLIAINCCALIMALWQAYIGRGMATEFSESKYIAMATVCIFQAFVMGVPIIYISEKQTTAFFFVTSVIILIICFSVLLLIFVPKYLIMHDKDRSSVESTFTAPDGRVLSVGGGTRISGLAPQEGASFNAIQSSNFASEDNFGIVDPSNILSEQSNMEQSIAIPEEDVEQ